MTESKLGRFEIPNRLEKIEDPNDANHVTFIAEPFEQGYGHTLGNSLRRVLLSSLEGAAIVAIRITGAQHEFSSLPGVVEDVTEIVLNLKKVKFKHNSKELRQLTIDVTKEGVVTAGDISPDTEYEVVNPDQVICHLDRRTKFQCELSVEVRRGFFTGEENKAILTNRVKLANGRDRDLPIDVIPIDSIFSPIVRVKYAVENTRVGQMTDFEKLTVDVWSDGRIAPAEAMLQASAILRHHLDVFVNYDDSLVSFDEMPASKQDAKDEELRRTLQMSVNEIELSVRAANCLNNANITTVGELAMKTEAEMLKYRNFGKKSLNEIKDKLVSLGLCLGAHIDPALFSTPIPTTKSSFTNEEPTVGISELIAQNLEMED